MDTFDSLSMDGTYTGFDIINPARFYKPSSKLMTYVSSAYSYNPELGYENASEIVSMLIHHPYFKYTFVYSPIVHWHNVAKTFNLPTDAQFWHEQNTLQLSKSDIMVISIDGPYNSSCGVQYEIGYAASKDIQILYCSRNIKDRFGDITILTRS